MFSKNKLIKNVLLLFMVIISLNSFGQDMKISKLDLIGCWTDSREETVANSGKSVKKIWILELDKNIMLIK